MTHIALTERGWRSLVVWDHELKDEGALSDKLRDFLTLSRSLGWGIPSGSG